VFIYEVYFCTNTVKMFSSMNALTFVHLSVGSTQNKTHSSMIISFSFLPGCGAHTSKVGAIRISENINDIQEEGDSSTLIMGNIKESLHYNTSYTKELLRQAKKRGSAETHYFSDVYYHIEVGDLKPGIRYYYKCMLIHNSKNHHKSYAIHFLCTQPIAYDFTGHIVSHSRGSRVDVALMAVDLAEDCYK